MKDKEKKNIDNLFKAVKYLNELIELLAYNFDSDKIGKLIKKVNDIHEIKNAEVRDKEDT